MEAVAVTFIITCICLAFWAVGSKDNKEQQQIAGSLYSNNPSSAEKVSLAYKELEEKEREEKKQREKEDNERKQKILAEKTKTLNESIQKAMKKEKSPNIKELLKTILETPVGDEFSFNEKSWLFNDGKLRKLSEIEQHEHELKEKYYDEHPEVFDSECRKVNTAALWIPFFIVFFMVVGTVSNDEFIMIFPFAIIAAMFAGLVGMGVGHKVNLERAKEYNIDNDRTAYERKELMLTKAGLLFTTVSTLHHAKKNLKDIVNVDSWKEMK